MKKFKPLRKKKNINFPYSKGKDKEDSSNQRMSEPEEKKTKIGLQSALPYVDQSDDQNEKGIKCPNCQYPLRVEPSASSPCPNCGFTDNEENLVNTISESGKTVNVGSLEYQKVGDITDLNFKLIDESINSEIRIESKDKELILNREHLDPSNSSISSEQHILLKIIDGKIYISDVSSNGATFIQTKRKFPIKNNTKIVLGNKFFSFKTKELSADAKSENSTEQIGNFNDNKHADQSFDLTDEGSGESHHFQGKKVLINRSSIDPLNTTFSSKEHAIFENDGSQWYLKDVSTNGATFIQITSETTLENKTKLILGNKVFRFELE